MFKHYYFICADVKNPTTGMLKRSKIVKCRKCNLKAEIDKFIAELKIKYSEVIDINTVNKL